MGPKKSMEPFLSTVGSILALFKAAFVVGMYLHIWFLWYLVLVCICTCSFYRQGCTLILSYIGVKFVLNPGLNCIMFLV